MGSDSNSWQFVPCTFQAHAAPILAIFNEAIANSTALYDYHQRTLGDMAAWFRSKVDHRQPVIGAVDATGQLLGFASYGEFRVRPAYKYSVEHSLYVHVDHRGKGVGRALLREIIAAATAQQYHLIVGGIDASNALSIRLHEQLGFSHAGTIAQAGFKFGRWLDLAFYQLLLPGPAHPVDG